MGEKRKFDEETLAVETKLNKQEAEEVLTKEGVRTILECPICMTIPGGKIYQCQNAHKICERCYDQLANERCPEGRCRYNSPEPSRYFEIENLIEIFNLTLECPYDDCKVTLKAKEMRIHEKECPKRPTNRPLLSCFMSSDCDTVALSDMESHLVEKHSMKIHEGNRLEQSQPLKKEDLVDGHFVNAVSDGNVTFYYVIMIHSHEEDSSEDDEEQCEGILNGFVVVQGEKDMADQYSATISIWKDGTSFKVESTQPVLSVLSAGYPPPLLGRHAFAVMGMGRIRDLISESDSEQEKLGFTHVLHHGIEIKKVE